jgi:hypothetical protein
MMLHQNPRRRFEDPIWLLYRSYLKKLQRGLLLLFLVLLAIWYAGLPHIQAGDYQYVGPPGGNASASQKTSAWYLSLTGWKQIRSGQFGQDGCPVILFVPIDECLFRDSRS